MTLCNTCLIPFNRNNEWLVLIKSATLLVVRNNFYFVICPYFAKIQVGAKFHYDFLTRCITNIENSNVHRKQEVAAYLRKRQHGAATTLGLRNARSPVPPQRTSSSPTVARCNSALAFTSTFANNDIFSNVSGISIFLCPYKQMCFFKNRVVKR